MDDLIKQYIAYPMAISIFKQEKERFKEFKLGNLYLDMLDSIIERMQKGFYQLKSELYSVYHLDAKRLDKRKYKVNDHVVEFSPEELKKLTQKIMSDYLVGDNASNFQRKDRIWSKE